MKRRKKHHIILIDVCRFTNSKERRVGIARLLTCYQRRWFSFCRLWRTRGRLVVADQSRTMHWRSSLHIHAQIPQSWVGLHAFDCIGVTGYGALGHVPPLHFQLFNFSVTSDRTNSDIRLYNGCLPRKNILAFSFIAVYCINFIIFSCVIVTLRLYSLNFVPLLAPNPGGDATVWP